MADMAALDVKEKSETEVLRDVDVDELAALIQSSFCALKIRGATLKLPPRTNVVYERMNFLRASDWSAVIASIGNGGKEQKFVADSSCCNVVRYIVATILCVLEQADSFKDRTLTTSSLAKGVSRWEYLRKARYVVPVSALALAVNSLATTVDHKAMSGLAEAISSYLHKLFSAACCSAKFRGNFFAPVTAVDVMFAVTTDSVTRVADVVRPYFEIADDSKDTDEDVIRTLKHGFFAAYLDSSLYADSMIVLAEPNSRAFTWMRELNAANWLPIFNACLQSAHATMTVGPSGLTGMRYFAAAMLCKLEGAGAFADGAYSQATILNAMRLTMRALLVRFADQEIFAVTTGGRLPHIDRELVHRVVKSVASALGAANSATLALTALADYIITEVLTLAANVASDSRSTTVESQHIMLAIVNDGDFTDFFQPHFDLLTLRMYLNRKFHLD